MSKIKLTSSPLEIAMTISQGNPGALAACVQILDSVDVDPDSAFGELTGFITLDSLGIYGTDVYVLWSDICHKDTPVMLAVLRATQLGLLEGSVVKEASSRQDYSGRSMIDLGDVVSKVKGVLPNFKL